MTAVVEQRAIQEPRLDAHATRWRVLDVVRGIAVGAMILVNNQGSGAHALWGLHHAEWNGWTPADVVFPLFLFAAGGALGLGRRSRRSAGRLLGRAALLFAIGLGLNALPPTSWAHFTVMGVLQRVALAWLLAALVVRHLSTRRQVQLAGLVLIAYWAALSALPMRPDLSVPGMVDQAVLGPAHMYRVGYDPQGIMGTLPATVSVLAGWWALGWLRRQAVSHRTALRMGLAGAVTVGCGQLWGLVFPINKRLWTSSFVLVGAGAAMVITAVVYEVVEVRRSKRGRALEALGSNPLVVFIGAEALTTAVLHRGFRALVYETMFHPVLGGRVGSLGYALMITGLWWAVARNLWHRQRFLSV